MSKPADARPLDARALTYAPVAATAVSEATWIATPKGYRRYEKTVVISSAWNDARLRMLRWGVKTLHLTIRSLTRPAANGFWRYSFPMLLAAQWVFRRRYLRSLDGDGCPATVRRSP